jgi:hypothetical protein
MSDLSGYSLSGGSDNTQLFVKSRSGHLVTLDDDGCTIRMQDATGDATISIENDSIHVIHKSGDINIFATELFRIDCKELHVTAGNDILFKAGESISTSVKGSTTVNAGANIFGSAKKDTLIMTKASFTGMSGTEMVFASNKQLSGGSEGGAVNIVCTGKVSFGAKGNLSLKATGPASIMAAAGADFKTNSECHIRAGAALICMANCINLN